MSGPEKKEMKKKKKKYGTPGDTLLTVAHYKWIIGGNRKVSMVHYYSIIILVWSYNTTIPYYIMVVGRWVVTALRRHTSCGFDIRNQERWSYLGARVRHCSAYGMWCERRTCVCFYSCMFVRYHVSVVGAFCAPKPRVSAELTFFSLCRRISPAIAYC